ncbi:CHC2 zinc finger domain-containing protein [Oleiagrimonas sp.]|jgi:hypothetical protein|uniref:CHC2 zinc finger domain-containing protein n=1 Tax=Oleiagrimonas sp. TaxID=2010330 RepID=UPI0026350D9D|nr:CHC2 zinc finger domain-containing protein [Oleiagrimonas sp.]MDA3914762.1 CHC2 zinc finger domain-containing protein [Oleiagrimonas sp.]
MNRYVRNPQKGKPHGGNRGAGITNHEGNRAYVVSLSPLYGVMRTLHIPPNWRERLPDPARYYAEHMEGLGKPNAEGWAPCRCPFHTDRNASASANLHTGGFRCHGCDAKGDLVAFHQRITGSSFKEAVRDLIGLGGMR